MTGRILPAILLLVVCFAGFATFDRAPGKSSAFAAELQSTQDGVANEEQDPSGEEPEYKKLLEEWKQVETELKRIRLELTLAEPSIRLISRSRFDRKMAEANEILPKLRQAAIDAYLQAPNQDEELIKLLGGMMISDAQLSRSGNDSANAMREAAVAPEPFQNDAKALEVAKLLIENGCDDRYFEIASTAPRLSLTQREIIEEARRRLRDSRSGKILPQVSMEISDAQGNPKGTVLIELFEDDAPNTVANFVSLVDNGFYDGLTFHRVLDGFMAQGGCPEGTGMGGPGYRIADEIIPVESRQHFTGSLSMANSGPDTNGSQFFLTFIRTSQLDGRHTVFGRVISGLDVVMGIQRRDPSKLDTVEPDRITKAVVIQRRDHPYEPVTLAEPTPMGGEDATTGGDATSDDATGDDATGDDATGDDATGDDATGGDATGGDATGDDATGDDATGDDATGGDATGGDATGGDATGGADTSGGGTAGDGSSGDDGSSGSDAAGSGDGTGDASSGDDGSVSGDGIR